MNAKNAENAKGKPMFGSWQEGARGKRQPSFLFSALCAFSAFFAVLIGFGFDRASFNRQENEPQRTQRTQRKTYVWFVAGGCPRQGQAFVPFFCSLCVLCVLCGFNRFRFRSEQTSIAKSMNRKERRERKGKPMFGSWQEGARGKSKNSVVRPCVFGFDWAAFNGQRE